jgi:hypothetical protein
MDERDPVVYWLDRNDRIVDLNEAWAAFARSNGGEGLEPEAVLGRPLRQFVSGDPTRMWLDAVLALARLKGEPVERAYRCDCPDLQRFMKMRVVPEKGEVLRLEHHLLSSRPRPAVRFIPCSQSVDGKPILRCSICCRIQDGENWREPAPRQEGPYLVVYTVCSECQQKMDRSL